MASLENNVSDKQTAGNNVKEEMNLYEDEINLVDYFLVLWKRKWFIFLTSVLPALVVGFILLIGPRDYKTTYLYDANLSGDEYRILLDRFYCEENVDNIVAGLKEKGLEKYVQQVTGAQQIENLEKLVNLEALPSFFGDASTKIKDLQKIPLDSVVQLTCLSK